VTAAGVREAAQTLAGIALRTPLIEAPFLAAVTGHPVRLKAEFQ